MMLSRLNLLTPFPALKESLPERVAQTMQDDCGIPVFSTTAIKLLDLSNHADLDMQTVTEIVALDPGLTTKYLRLANSVAFSTRPVTSIQDALIRIGMNEVRKMAATIGVMEVLSDFTKKSRSNPKNPHVEVEWEMFWLHSIFTARLMDVFVSTYRETSGKEYLTGLLHDVGKLFLRCYFPEEFQGVMEYSARQKCPVVEAEKCLFDTTHAEIGGSLCQKWHLHPDIIHSVQFHHFTPTNEEHQKDVNHQFFLKTCLCVANSLSNLCNANIQGGGTLQNIEFESLPDWRVLQGYPPRYKLQLDILKELKKSQEAMQILIH